MTTAQTPNADSIFITTKEAARILGIDESIAKVPETVVRAMIRRGELRGRKIGKTIMVLRASIDEYVRASLAAPAA